MSEGLVCWKCGASIADQPLPLARVAACAACRSDLHVCRLCEFYDRRAAKQCREPVADEVQDKERANFCGYFQVRYHAYQAQDLTAAEAAKARLEELFGGDGGSRKEHQDKAVNRSQADIAKERLEQLFNKGGGG